MPARWTRRRWRQRGVAVITALLLTTLAVAIVASLFWQQQVQVRSMENQRLHLQTKWILRGALDYTSLILDTFRGGYTSLDQAWALPVAETRLDQYIERERVAGENFDATLSGNVTDASARYNLRNLADSNGPVPDQVALFKNLLRNLQLEQSIGDRLAAYVFATLPPAAPTGNGTGGTVQPPVQRSAVTGKPISLLQVDDLLAVPGITQEMIERLRPFVIVLPSGNTLTTVNVNTAPPELLSAMVVNLSISEANTLVAQRKQAPWKNMGDFTNVLSGRVVTAANSADVKSDWFLVDSRIRLDRAALDAQSLIYRPSGMVAGGTRVMWTREN
ncbi:MAG: general secretion pathway protein GspK [Oxalobacteraceae bacterium]|nr:MAG: general secretion pathway protein GspK [Oxalobacteraceae bacterium]